MTFLAVAWVVGCSDAPGSLPGNDSVDGGAGPTDPGSEAPEMTMTIEGDGLVFENPGDVGLPRIPFGEAVEATLRFGHEGEPARYWATMEGEGFELDGGERTLEEGETIEWTLRVAPSSSAQQRFGVLRLQRGEAEERITIEAEFVSPSEPRVWCRNVGGWRSTSRPDVLRGDVRCDNLSSTEVAIWMARTVQDIPLPPTTPALGQVTWSNLEVRVPSAVPLQLPLRASTGGVITPEDLLGPRISLPPLVEMTYGPGPVGRRAQLVVANRLPVETEISALRIEEGSGVSNGRFDFEGVGEGFVLGPRERRNLDIAVVPETASEVRQVASFVVSGVEYRTTLVAKPDFVPGPSCLDQLVIPDRLEVGPIDRSALGEDDERIDFSFALRNASEVPCRIWIQSDPGLQVVDLLSVKAEGVLELSLGPGSARVLGVRLDPDSPIRRTNISVWDSATLGREIPVTIDDDPDGLTYDWRQAGPTDPFCPSREERAITIEAREASSIARVDAGSGVQVSKTALGFRLMPGAGSPRCPAGTVRLERTGANAVRLPFALGCRVEEGEIVRERFEIEGGERLDVVFILDDSGSMSSWLRAEREVLDAFIQNLEAHRLDYRVAAVPLGDSIKGEFDPDVFVTPATRPSPRQVFLEAASVERRGGIERGLQAWGAARHLWEAGRAEARFMLVLVTDEPDQSPDPRPERAAAFLAFGPDPRFLDDGPLERLDLWLVGGGRQGCTGEGGAVPPQPALTSYVESLGGRVGSLCGDWSRKLVELMMGFGPPDPSLRLATEPAFDAIEVFVDGEAVPETAPSGVRNWGYDVSKGAIRFPSLSAPGPGSVVEVWYRPACLR